jgi:hypothetical protein
LEGEGSAQGPERKNLARADPGSAVDDDEAEVLPDRWILEAVIHDNHICGRRFEETGSSRPVPAYGYRRRCREKEGLIAYAAGIV